jgi:hypothetical protein
MIIKDWLIIRTVLLALVMLACSSATSTQADDESSVGGETSEAGAAGMGSSIGGVSGGGEVSISGSSSTGGAAGGSTGVVGGSTNVATGGSTCIAKTCADIVPVWDAVKSTLSKPTACGVTTDGCGGVLSCGACLTDGTVNTDCGQAPPADEAGDWSGYGLVPTPNVCGTRCVKVALCDVGIDNWLCPSTIPPIGIANCRIVSTYKTAQSWCCNI